MTLNIKEVTLYQSGVGFFTADCPKERFTLPVNEDDINDVLKSLSVNGLKSVRFSSAEERERVLNKIGIDLESEGALLSICHHLIGLQVNVRTDKEVYTGIVIGVDEVQDDSSDDEEMENLSTEILVLKIDDEIRYFPLNEIKSIDMLDLTIQKDLKTFLDFTANERKAGVINLQIEAQPDTWATWIMPVSSWRLSYRIFFNKEKNQLDLFGISVVDNTTSIDWDDVVLRLVTGRPVSFQYDLFNPLFIDRPEIKREVKGVAPIVSEAGGMFDFDDETTGVKEGMMEPAVAPPPPGAPAPALGAGPPKRATAVEKRKIAMKPLAKPSVRAPAKELKPKVEAMKQEIGSAVAYVVNYPVSITRSQSALIPILNEKLGGELCVILRDDRINEAMDAIVLQKPLELEKGAATVYLDGIFAGDSMIIGGTEFIAFRLNQEINAIKEIKTKSKTKSISIEGAYLSLEDSSERIYTFKFVNRSKESAPIILEVAKYNDYKPEEKPEAETTDFYRYRYTLKPGNSVKKLTFKSIFYHYEAIANLSERRIKELLEKKLMKPADIKRMNEILSGYRELQRKEQEQNQIENEIRKEFDNQQRIRENIIVIKDEEDLREEYLQKLKDAERHLENLKVELNKTRAEVEELREKVSEF